MKLSNFLEKRPIETLREINYLLENNASYFEQFNENWLGLLKALVNFYVKGKVYQKRTGLWVPIKED
jgi:hypothetical protein